MKNKADFDDNVVSMCMHNVQCSQIKGQLKGPKYNSP